MHNCPEQEDDLKARTFSFARGIVRLFRALPAGQLEQVLGRQLLRCGTSIGANYREAKRARSRLEFIAKLGDCLKEAEETEYWLDLMAAEGVVASERTKVLRSEAGQLAAIFITIINNTRRRNAEMLVQEDISEYGVRVATAPITSRPAEPCFFDDAGLAGTPGVAAESAPLDTEPGDQALISLTHFPSSTSTPSSPH